jgi:hypothetical protein
MKEECIRTRSKDLCLYDTLVEQCNVTVSFFVYWMGCAVGTVDFSALSDLVVASNTYFHLRTTVTIS